jgi:hypothetical protein
MLQKKKRKKEKLNKEKKKRKREDGHCGVPTVYQITVLATWHPFLHLILPQAP